jgi:hypothetical protein
MTARPPHLTQESETAITGLILFYGQGLADLENVTGETIFCD